MLLDVNAYLGHFAFRQLRYNNAAGLLRLMDRAGIDRALVSSASSIAYRNPQAGNDEIATEIKPHGDRLIGCAVLSPEYAGWRDDLKICHEQFGMRGVRLYPRWHNYRLNDPACVELVNLVAARNMSVSIPLRVEDRRQGSWLVDIPDVNHEEIAGLIRLCHQARFILLNGSGYVASSLGRRNSGLPRNYCIDIALLTVEQNNEAAQLMSNLGEDRMVFGTGIPFHYAGPALTKLDLLDVSEAAKDRIRWRNAAAWMRL